MDEMNMVENARFILGLRAAGWSEKEINDFILIIETGENNINHGKNKQEKNARSDKLLIEGILFE